MRYRAEAHPDSGDGEEPNGFPGYAIAEPFGNKSVLRIFSCLAKPEKLFEFLACGMYTEQDKETELTLMESLPCVGMYWRFKMVFC